MSLKSGRRALPLALASLLASGVAFACIWDSDTLKDEKAHSPKLADVILGTAAQPPDLAQLRQRVEQLTAQPRTLDPAWWNDLAGARIRLGQPEEAVKLLEPVVSRFPDDYGIHANLGTAYHLLGRYADAAREIARDLELNPEAHFGREKYHLALLQYLARDAEYQKAHLYVDEWSEAFFTEALRVVRAFGPKTGAPEQDPKFEEGVIYMASLNPREPACFVMLGVAAQRRGVSDLNLAAAAYKKAIALGSPQAGYLQKVVDAIEEHIAKAQAQHTTQKSLYALVALAAVTAIVLFVLILWKKIIKGVLPKSPA